MIPLTSLLLERVDYTLPIPRWECFISRKRWGAAVGVASYLRKRIWMRVQHDTPAVREFLRPSPFIVIDGKGDLPCMVFTRSTGVTIEKMTGLHKSYYSPGLKGPIVRPVDDLLEGLGEVHSE
ncbi:MAG: hypothetical protein M1358_11495 [Chloroflexi bacterium]|nr:hypothetical protein [Chloroflexota bacterium]